MIGRLGGILVESSPGRVVLDVSGVGYEVQIPLSTFYELPEPGEAQPVQLYIHTHVRADALQLYGFARAEERRAFELLIAISGVGPRMALAFLSGIGVKELTAAVHDGDRARLQRIPGVGKKTAERVLLELADRIGFDEPDDPRRTAATAPTADRAGPREEAVSALLNLGYARETAQRAIAAAVAETDDPATLETVLRSALRRLVGSG
jgi:Holliday junction DNA helicase RuvA